jgi:hypothetical protein
MTDVPGEAPSEDDEAKQGGGDQEVPYVHDDAQRPKPPVLSMQRTAPRRGGGMSLIMCAPRPWKRALIRRRRWSVSWSWLCPTDSG